MTEEPTTEEPTTEEPHRNVPSTPNTGRPTGPSKPTAPGSGRSPGGAKQLPNTGEETQAMVYYVLSFMSIMGAYIIIRRKS